MGIKMKVQKYCSSQQLTASLRHANLRRHFSAFVAVSIQNFDKPRTPYYFPVGQIQEFSIRLSTLPQNGTLLYTLFQRRFFRLTATSRPPPSLPSAVPNARTSECVCVCVCMCGQCSCALIVLFPDDCSLSTVLQYYYYSSVFLFPCSTYSL